MLSQDSQLERDRKALFVELAREIASKAVLQAMERVPRELFVPPEVRAMAYLNIPLSIGDGQTISQPYIVARMAEVLDLRGDEKVLEVGTGSGYQAAVLSRLLPRGRLLTVERKPRLAESARARLADLGYANVTAELAGPVLGAERQASFRRHHCHCGLPPAAGPPGSPACRGRAVGRSGGAAGRTGAGPRPPHRLWAVGDAAGQVPVCAAAGAGGVWRGVGQFKPYSNLTRTRSNDCRGNSRGFLFSCLVRLQILLTLLSQRGDFSFPLS